MLIAMGLLLRPDKLKEYMYHIWPYICIHNTYAYLLLFFFLIILINIVSSHLRVRVLSFSIYVNSFSDRWKLASITLNIFTLFNQSSFYLMSLLFLPHVDPLLFLFGSDSPF